MTWRFEKGINEFLRRCYVKVEKDGLKIHEQTAYGYCNDQNSNANFLFNIELKLVSELVYNLLNLVFFKLS